jgi:hypothetical protein
MSTFPPERQDDDADITEQLARTVDGSQSDEPADPAMEAVIEAGGGVGGRTGRQRDLRAR